MDNRTKLKSVEDELNLINEEVIRFMSARNSVVLHAYPGDAETNARNHKMLTPETEYLMGLERDNNTQLRDIRLDRTQKIQKYQEESTA